LWVSRDLAGIEDEAARSSLAELRWACFLALGNRNAEATCHEEFGHDLLGSGRGKDLLDAEDSRKCDVDHIDDCPDSSRGSYHPKTVYLRLLPLQGFHNVPHARTWRSMRSVLIFR
jgi:hypothetical protein